MKKKNPKDLFNIHVRLYLCNASANFVLESMVTTAKSAATGTFTMVPGCWQKMTPYMYRSKLST